jgi:hypothetical protein
MGLVVLFRGQVRALAVVSCASAALVGCPAGAELENSDRFTVFHATDAGPTSCDEQPPDTAQFGCDYPMVLQTYCAKGTCHSASQHLGGLDLTVNSLLIARVLDVPAKHTGSTCSGGVRCEASMATCDRCDRCPPNALLVDQENPAESWILKKMEQFIPGTMTANVNIGCGDTMPSFLGPGNIVAFSDDDKRCLNEFFLHIATQTPNPDRWPCTIAPAMPDGGT